MEGLGYLDGGTEANVRFLLPSYSPHEGLMTVEGRLESGFTLLASPNTVSQVRNPSSGMLTISEFTTFPLPPPYSTRVKSALNASAPSVKLSSLVGGSGWWYRWGRKIAEV